MGSRNGVSTEKIWALTEYANSPLFTDAEKVALEYADAITDTRRDVDDELFARMQQHYDDDTIAEVTMIIAWENASSSFFVEPETPASSIVPRSCARGTETTTRRVRPSASSFFGTS